MIREMGNEHALTSQASFQINDLGRRTQPPRPSRLAASLKKQKVTRCIHKLDHWLEMMVPGTATLQRVFPGQIVEYKSLRAAAMGQGAEAWSKKNLRSRGARIVCFPLNPKPHQVTEDWLQQMWRGDDAEGPRVDGGVV